VPHAVSTPHVAPLHAGVQHAALRHTWPAAHAQSAGHEVQLSLVWQMPSPHPAWAKHVPLALQACPLGQLPQRAPHPSGPHCFPAHWRAQHAALLQICPLEQAQSAQLAQFSPV
jgi:hypothetical protein